MLRVFETCIPRDEVLAGKLTDDMFAAKLDKVVDGEAADVYQDPNIFLARTYPTAGLKALLAQVMSRVTNAESTEAPIIRLETSFGGGKTHGLIALYHLARNAQSVVHIPPDLIDPALVPDEPIPFAAVVGTELDPINGIRHGDVTTYTMWGEIAYQLAGPEGYALMEKSDREFTRPGSGVWEELLGGRPAIICIDEIASFQRAFGRKHAGAEQTAAFLHTLFGVVSSMPRVCVVWTLATAGDAFAGETERLVADIRELGSIGAREEVVLTPTGDTEYAPVINHRLFDQIDSTAAQAVADEFLRFYDQQAARGVALPSEATTHSFQAEMQRAYPFHPATIDVLSLKTAAIPNFQRTRGMLRLLAHVVRQLWAERPEDAYFIQPYHLDFSVEHIRDELTSRLDRGEYKTVIEADIHRGDGGAHAQKLDVEWRERGKPPLARRVANTIMAHSITTGQARGATDADINLACGVPGLDFDFIAQALEGLYRECWYIDPDRTRYRFQAEPQINRIIHEEIQRVETSAAKEELHARIRSMYAGKFLQPVFFPNEPGDVDDNAQKPKLVIVDFDAETVAGEDVPHLVINIFERKGSQGEFRTYQNNLLFLVADAQQRDPMIDVARRYVALSRLANPARLAEYEEKQRGVLMQRKREAELDLAVAITRAYRHLFYPDHSETGLTHHMMDVQESAQADRNQENVLIDLLHQLTKLLNADDKPLGPQYARARVWRSGEQELSTAEYARRFAINRDLPMVMVADQHKRTIKAGAKDGTWVYYDGDEQKAYYQVAPPMVSIDEDHMLYTYERAEELGLLKPPVETCPTCGKPKDQCTCVGPPTCPLCGKPRAQCTCGVDGTTIVKEPVSAEGTPKKAFTELADKAEAADVALLSALTVTVDAVQELLVLALALPQLVELQMTVSVGEGRYVAEFEGGDARLEFRGPWEKLHAVREFIEAFDRQATARHLRVAVQMQFERPVAPGGKELGLMRDTFDRLSLGKIELKGVPAEEAGEDG